MASIGIINSHMFGREAEPGEHVDWSAPDIYDEEEWREVLGMSVVDFAATSPHMIVFYVEEEKVTYTMLAADSLGSVGIMPIAANSLGEAQHLANQWWATYDHGFVKRVIITSNHPVLIGGTAADIEDFIDSTLAAIHQGCGCSH